MSSAGRRIEMRGHSCSVMPPSCETLAEVLREGVANLAGIASARWNRIGGLPGDCRTAVSVGAGRGEVPTWAGQASKNLLGGFEAMIVNAVIGGF